jgi:very-short-patch-repair endonuclease
VHTVRRIADDSSPKGARRAFLSQGGTRMAGVNRRHDLDAAIDRLARRQHGVFTAQQVLAAGGTARMIHHRRSQGRWIGLARGVYALASHPTDWLRQLKAAELSVAGSAVSGKSAAALWAIDGFRPGHIELIAPRGAGRATPLATVRHRSWPFEVTQQHQITVLSPPHVVLTLMGAVGIRSLERAVDHIVVNRLSTIEAVAEAFELVENTRLPGVAQLGALIDDRLTGYVPPTSELERALEVILRSPGMPDFETQAGFPWWPDAPFLVDAFIPAWRRIVEADGRLWHTRAADFERDRWRDHLAQSHGYEVTRFTYRQVLDVDYARGVLAAIGAHATA